jgi:ubiquinone/menaquinone biosynthesis C-methylase UbiE
VVKPTLRQRLVAGIYSVTAEHFYEPIVVKRAFPLLGGDLNQLALEQGRRAVSSADGDPILDMPIGTGFFTVQVARISASTFVGVDIAAGMVVQARRAALSADASNITVVQANAHSLPFPDDSFAAILCTNGLQVIPGLNPAVSELARVLRPGGTLYTSVVTLALSRVMPVTGRILPTMLRSGWDVAEAISATGLFVTHLKQRRLATLIEATKPL